MAAKRPKGATDGVLFQLRLWASELHVGTTSRHECPFCGGGSTREASFAITRVEHDKCKYICHRASCGAHGSLSRTLGLPSETDSDGGGGTSPVPVPRRTGEAYSCPTERLDRTWLSYLSERFGLLESEVNRQGWVQEVNSGRLVVYLRARDGRGRGVHTRARENGPPPRTRDYRGEGNYVGWYEPIIRIPASPIILLEDVISAAKAAQAGFLACSLMGCNLSLDVLQESFQGTGGTCLIALDRDATSKAIRFAREHQFVVAGNLLPLLLSKDLKYHKEEEIQDMVNQIVHFRS